MRKLFLFCFFQLYCAFLYSQTSYWQQETNYNIDVSLNDKEHSLDAFEQVEYINHSPDTLRFIWFHLWPNAYKNDKTAFSDQLLENGNTRFYFSGKEQRGYINRLDFKVNGITAQTTDHPQHIDIIKVLLPAPLAPGEKIMITTPFHVKLPYNFSRGGHDGESYQVTQWYPKPAVYDKEGWHPMPYLDQGEFYSEFGAYTVNITLPANYVVAATGDLQNTEEKEWLKTRSAELWGKEYKMGTFINKKVSTTYSDINNKARTMISYNKDTIPDYFPASAETTKTLTFIQSQIHDFAWFADKRFIVGRDSCQLSTGKIIDVYSYYTLNDEKDWQHAVGFAKKAVRHYSHYVGSYPFNVVSVVQGPESFGGGMEYPTITIISPVTDAKSLDEVIAHEIGHNWFYGILGTNERDHPWMDEGINSYYEALYDSIQYGSQPEPEKILFETAAVTKTDQAIETPSEKFSETNYNLIAYYKTAAWLRYLESMIGSTAFHKGMQDYYNEWKFKHPQPGDFKAAMEKSSRQNLDTPFAYLNKTGLVPGQEGTGTTTVFIFDFKRLGAYVKKPSNNLILLGPALGFNSYDKLMIGAFATNLKLPPSPFQFLVAPMYATGARKMTGLGFANYTFYPQHLFRKIETGISASTFTADQFTDGNGKKFSLGFRKIVPGIRFTFREKNPRNFINRYIQFKSFLINEDGLHFYRDTVISGTDTTISNQFTITGSNRTLHQLKLVIENDRALYPYRGELKIEQGKDFVRTAFTGNYFFNYPKQGGLGVRLFAGKFIYTSARTFAKQFATDRYHLNMTGANGYEDYTYADYFIGRNKFEGASSQQIMVRDGGFKVRTDLLADKVGKTDDWLAAVNFSSSIPNSINPLSLLPVKIPLKIFLDIGTYADFWKTGAETDRFIFDAGLHIPLLNELVNIYIPLVYSSVYKNYLQSTIPKKERFFKKISFSIDIANFRTTKIDRTFQF